MKIDKEYGGLGLSNLHYCKALTLVGSVSPAVGALLSAHQSIGVPQPLKLFGTAEQKKAFLPRLAAGEVSAFLLTEPDVGSDPARLATVAEPVEGGYRLNGVKLWATNGTVATLLVVMARVPDKGITAFVVEGDAPGITVERRNAFLGLRGLENSVTRFHDVFVPAENVIGGLGKGLKIALTTLNTGRLSLPAMCVGAGKWSLDRRPRVVGASGCSGAARSAQHEAVAKKIAFIAATTYAMESMLDLCCVLADDDQQRHPHRGRAGQALRQRDGLAGRRRADPDPRRPRLREGRVAGRPRRTRRPRPSRSCATCGSTASSRAPPRSCTCSSPARRSTRTSSVAGDIIDPEAGLGRKARAGARAGAFYAKWLPTLAVGRGQVPTRVRRVRPARRAPAVRRAGLAQARPVDVLRDVALAGQAGAQAGLPRPDRRHRSGAVRDVRGVRARPRRARRTAPRASSWPTCSAGRPGCGRRRSSPRSGTTPTRSTSRRRGACWTGATPSWRRASSTSRPTRPGSPRGSRVRPPSTTCAGASRHPHDRSADLSG